MYKIYYYDFPVYDDKLQELYPITAAGIKQEVNTAGEVNFSIPAMHPHFSELKKLKMGIRVVKGDGVIFKGRIVNDKQDFSKTKKIVCEGKLATLNDSVYRPFDFSGSPSTFFTNLITNHNSQVSDEQKFIVGNITVADPNDYIVRSSINHKSTWELVKNLVGSLGGYVNIRYEQDGDYIDWLADFNYTNTQRIEFAENLINITQEVSAEETYTACIPLGAEVELKTYGEIDTGVESWQENKYYILSGEIYSLIETELEFNGIVTAGTTIYEIKTTEPTGERLTIESVNDNKDYLINADKAAEYGLIYAPTDEVTWDDVTIPENLLSKATAFLNNTGVMLAATLELDAVDLAYADADMDSFEWCQYVQVKSVPHALETTYLLSKINVDMLRPENTKITLGDTQKTLYDSFLGQQQVVDGVIEQVEKINADYTTNEKVRSEILEASSQILQTAQQITIGVLAGYATASDLESYRSEIQNLLDITQSGFNFEFCQIEQRLSALGNEIVERNQFIRLEEGNIIIGKSDSPIMAKFTNDALEFMYNNQTVAKFTNEVLEVRNIRVENQLALGNDWAIRPGNFIAGEGYNLNIMWIGG